MKRDKLNISANNFFLKNRKGLSTIVASLLMVLLVIIIVGVVWGVTKGIVDKNTDASCFANYGKITLNNDYTCYELDKSTNQYNLRFSIDVGDIDIDGVAVTLVDADGSKSFELKKNAGIISGLKNYDGTTSIKSPDKNEGATYNATNVGKTDSVRIAPIINGKQCDVSDSINEIENCLVFA
mgnify:CR=1 FL=1